MKGRILLVFTWLCVGGLAYSQIPEYRVALRLDDDLQRLQGKVDLRWDMAKDSLPEKIWLEFWPLAYSSTNSILAHQWLEDQETRFHFSKPEERVRLDSLRLYDRSGQSVLQLHKGRSPELLWFYRDSLKSEDLQLEAFFELLLPEEAWGDYGRRADGLLLNHSFVRFSAFFDGDFHPSPRLREGDRNSQLCRMQLELDLPPHYFPITALPESGTIQWNRHFASSDLTFLTRRQRYQFESAQCSDGLALFVTPVARPVRLEDERAVWCVRSEVPAFTADVSKLFRAMGQWLTSTYAYNDSLDWTIIFTEEKLPAEPIPGMLYLHARDPGPFTELAMAERYFRSVLAQNTAAVKAPWSSSGLANYMAYAYMEERYPTLSLSGPFENSLIARFFKVDELPISYQNQLLYLYLARQGLDQSSSDSAEAFTQGTYEAQMKAKVAMQMNYLHDYMGDRRFRAGIADYLMGKRQADRFRESMKKNSPYKPIDWFFDRMMDGAQPLDIRLHETESCPSLFVVTSSSRKNAALPYPVSGFIGDSLVMTEWFSAHEEREGKNVYKADYDRVRVADPLRYPDLFGKDNVRKTQGWLTLGKPLELQLYTNFENPYKHQVYWLPSLNYNAYDQLLLGVSLYNTTLIPKKFEYRITPEYSTGANELTGYFYSGVNFPLFEGPVRLISSGIFYRRYNYAPGLAYNRLSPAITLHFRKTYPRSPYIRRLRLRHVYVDLELAAGETDEVGESGYSVFNARYTQEYTDILRPHTLRADVQVGDLFTKLSIEYDQRWMLPNRKWMILRLFGGWMPYNNNPQTVDLFDFGISGTQDYLFDFYFIGRSDESGIWSQQYFVSDGGFRANLNQFGRTHILAANLSIPLFNVLGVYGDVGTVGGPVEWSYGMRLALLTDFLEVYFPIQSRQRDHFAAHNYLGETRFVLDLDLDAIINRLRRGFY